MARITWVHSREILDSRGNPTVEVEVRLSDGSLGRASVPSGASTGKAEAVELRDGDMSRYRGRGVRKAVENVKFIIGAALQGVDALDQEGVDRRLLELDGTPNKSHLGANALLGVSLAVARAAAASAKMPLYRYLGGPTATELPVPMVNILSGGVHGGDNFDFQDFLVVPLRTRGYAEALEDVAAVYLAMKDVLKDRGIFQAGAADEGGYAPRLESNEAGFALMVEAIERAGLRPGEDAAIAVDLAASQFGQMGTYRLAIEGGGT
jgi:enolase